MRAPRAALPQAYDQHLNILLGEVEETITVVEIDEETYEEIVKVRPQCPGRAARGKRAVFTTLMPWLRRWTSDQLICSSCVATR